MAADGIRLVVVPPGDKALFFAECLACGGEFGKGEQDELAFEVVGKMQAIHYDCLTKLASTPTPAEITERESAAWAALSGERAALAVESGHGALREAG